MAAVTFDDEPAKPAAKGGAVTFDDDDALAPKFSGAPQVPVPADREQELRGEALRRFLKERGEPAYGTRARDAGDWKLGRVSRGLWEAVAGEIDENIRGTSAPATFGERYRAGYGAETDYVNRAKSEENTNPYLGAAADVGGTMASAIPTMAISGPALLGQGLRTGANAGINAGRYALNSLWPVAEATTQGAIEGVAGNAGTNVIDAVTGGVKGAVSAAATSPFIAALLNRFGSVQGAQRRVGEATRGPDAAALRAEAEPLYTQLRNAQAGFDAPQMGQLRTELQTALQGQGYTPGGTHSVIAPIYDALTSRQPTPFTSTAQGPTGSVGLKEYYEQLGALASNPDASVRNIAGRLRQTMDDFFENNTPAHNPNNIDIPNIWPGARDAWRRNKRVGEMDWEGDKATATADRSATRTPADTLGDMAHRTINKVTKPDNVNPYNAEQMAILQQMREGGGRAQRMLQGVGGLLTAPTDWMVSRVGRAVAPVAPAGFGAGVGVISNRAMDNPVSTTVAALGGLGLLTGARAIGTAMKTGAGEYAQRDLDTLLRNISTGSSAMPANVNLDRGTLARLFARTLAQRTGGAMAAGYATEAEPRTLDDAEQLRLGARKLVP